MGSRLDLHEEICSVLGSRNAYFQAPSSKTMNYPCVRYAKGKPTTTKANNGLYGYTECYEGVVMDFDPDSEIPKKLLQHFKMCSLGKSYTVDGLNHTPFTLHY
jgi:hypothetical protein